MKTTERAVSAPCETCRYKNGLECFNVLAMLKTARSVEMELYNHGVEGLVSGLVLPCSNYVSENNAAQMKYRKIV